MAQELERLIVTLDADLRKYQQALAKAQGVTVTQLRKVEREVEASKKRMSNAFAGLGGFVRGGIAGAVAGLVSVQTLRAMREVVGNVAEIGDQAQRLGLTTDEFQKLAFVAKLGGVEVDSFANAMKKLGINSSDAARGSGELGAILEANGVKITDANGKMLSQVEILQRVAELIKNAASEQDKMAIAQAAFGKSGTDMLSALEGGAKGVARAFADAAETKPIDEETIRVAKELDDEFTKIWQLIVNNLNPAIVWLESYLTTAMKVGLESVYNLVDGFYMLEKAIGVIDSIPQHTSVQGKDNPEAEFLKTHDLQGKKIGVVRPSGTTIIPGDDDKNKKTRTGGGGGGGGTKTANEYEQETKAIQQQIDALKLQGEQMGKTAAEAAKLEAEHRLLNAAQEAGLKITPELKASIEALATQYGAATDALSQLSEQQQRIEDVQGSLKDTISGFVDDLRSGVDVMDALGNAAENLISKLTDLALNSLLDQLLGSGGSGGLFGGGASGGLGTILSTFLGGFRASGGSVSAGRPYVVGEQGPELFVPGQSGSIVPNGRMGGGGINIKVIDNAGTTLRAQPDNSGDQRGILLVIDQRVQRQVGDPYSKTSSALTARGAKVAAKRR